MTTAPAAPATTSYVDRRVLLHGALAGAAGLLGACGADDAPATTETPRPSASQGSGVLLAYFSRAGENYYYGDRRDLRVGNTEVLAGLIAARLDCTVFRIEATEAYPDGYDATVARNVREQEGDVRPLIAGTLPELASYRSVLLASPIWNVRPPMIMQTFAEALDFKGLTVHPVATYAVSGLGQAADTYRTACEGAEIGEELAVRGETVRDAAGQVTRWLRRTGLTDG